MTEPSPGSMSIGAVERETGLSKDTLRVWERRYQFPVPERDGYGERAYPLDQVEKLRLVKRLMDIGHRPGKIVAADIEVLRGMAAQAPGVAGAPGLSAGAGGEHGGTDLQHYIGLCKSHRNDSLRRDLSQALVRMGMYRFVTEVVAPLTSMVGERWAGGELAVFEEHLFTECVHGVMRNALSSIPAASLASRPNILLTTIPHEAHGLGLLMAEAVFSLEGAPCTSLGIQTPILEIVRAANAQSADIVALSFSSSTRSAHALEALADLRAELPSNTEIWVGGRCTALQRKAPPEVKVLELHEIRDALIDWRRRNATTGPD